MARRKQNENLSYYFAELLILILGISASFILNEWRISQDEEKLEHEMLLQFHDNLVIDSAALWGGGQGLDLMVKSANKLLDLEVGDQYYDSVAFHVTLMLNFTGFFPTDVAYQEMKSLGNSRIIKNKDLLKEIIALYESQYTIVNEWATVDRKFLLDDFIPYANETFPFARSLNFGALSNRKKQQLMNILTDEKTKNQIQTSLIMKTGTKQVFNGVLDEVRGVVELLNQELEDQL